MNQYRCDDCFHTKRCRHLLGDSYRPEGPCDWDPSRYHPPIDYDATVVDMLANVRITEKKVKYLGKSFALLAIENDVEPHYWVLRPPQLTRQGSSIAYRKHLVEFCCQYAPLAWCWRSSATFTLPDDTVVENVDYVFVEWKTAEGIKKRFFIRASSDEPWTETSIQHGDPHPFSGVLLEACTRLQATN